LAGNNNLILCFSEKNKKALTYLGYSQDDVWDEIQNLKETDYCQGPLVDNQGYANDFWVFGKIIQGYEVYIKLKVKDFNSEGEKQLSLLCISFHFSERPLVYPLKFD
jgi:hypothetical protein